MHLRTLLAECAKKLNEFGPDSPEVNELIRKNAHNQEFVELAELARKLKREVLARTMKREAWRSSHQAKMAKPSSETPISTRPPESISRDARPAEGGRSV